MQKSIITLDPIYSDFGNFQEPEVLVETGSGWTPDPNLSQECGPCIDIIKSFINSDEFLEPVENYTKTENFEKLIGRITKKLIYFDSEFTQLDKILIEKCFVNPLDNPNLHLSNNDIHKLIKEAYILGYITIEQLNNGILNPSIFKSYIAQENYIKLLQYQLTYEPIITRYIPTVKELQDQRGLDSYVYNYVNTQFYSLLENNELFVHNQVEQYLNKKYSSDTFLSSEKIQLIYKYPTDFLKILDTNELIGLLERTRYYLTFLTDAKVSILTSLSDSANITTYLTINEIKEILDKEVDLKNSIIKALTLEEINKVFESFKILFMNQELAPLVLKVFEDNFLIDEITAKTIIKKAIIFAEENKHLDLLQGL
jgi:hypothetical protein